MPPKEESSKIFFDVLSDYWDLKYIFEYGFYWDKRITHILLSKGCQTVRELANILVEPIYQNSATTSWWKHTAGNNTKKSQRILTWNNHYRLATDLWFQRLYACFGAHNCYGATEHILHCPEQFYSYCSDNRCSYRRLCQIEEMTGAFRELSNTPTAPSVNDHPLFPDISRQYADVVISGRQLSLKKNTWTKEYFEDHGILSSSDNKATYESFLDMIRFFACFSPLSVLGIHFLRHLSVPETRQSFALIRNLPPDFGLEQEYIYRSLYAIVNHLTIFYDKEEYLPQKIRYRDKNMNGMKEHLYLEACKIENKVYAGEPALLPLFNGTYLEVGKPFSKRLQMSAEGAQSDSGCPTPDNNSSEPTITCTVDYYYNSDTSYLINRRYEGWKEDIFSEQELSETFFLDSPYYPEDWEWRADRVIYHIHKYDYPGFRLYIDSFGDFAHLHPVSSPTDIALTDLPATAHSPKDGKRGKMNECASLLSIYNSDLLLEQIQKPLPPRQMELEWLSFILDYYPHMCRMFLDDNMITQLKDKLLSDEALSKEPRQRQVPAGWFLKSRYDFPCRVADLPGHTVAKYRGILDAVRMRKVLVYEYHDKSTHVFPYALEYDVTRHLTNQRDMPIDIMCYSLDEMRTIRILYKEIRIKNAQSQESFSFSEMQKLYHILAYGLRCAFTEKESVLPRLTQIFDHCWQTNPEKYNDNYTRCVKKKFQRYLKKDIDSLPDRYLAEYKKTRRSLDKSGCSEDIAFFEQAFHYYYQQAIQTEKQNPDPLSDFQWKYQLVLLDIFRSSYETLDHTARGSALKNALADVDDMDIWELIAGDETDGIENEIAFFNEQFQNAEVSFILKEISEQNIDLVYHLFSNFICVGETLPDNRLQFTITYENFYYRKIHMLLMALEPMIEQITPAQTADIIKKRHDNKEAYHHV